MRLRQSDACVVYLGNSSAHQKTPEPTHVPFSFTAQNKQEGECFVNTARRIYCATNRLFYSFMEMGNNSASTIFTLAIPPRKY